MDHSYVFMSKRFCMDLVCVSFSMSDFWSSLSESPSHHVKCLALWWADHGSSGHHNMLVSRTELWFYLRFWNRLKKEKKAGCSSPSWFLMICSLCASSLTQRDPRFSWLCWTWKSLYVHLPLFTFKILAKCARVVTETYHKFCTEVGYPTELLSDRGGQSLLLNQFVSLHRRRLLIDRSLKVVSSETLRDWKSVSNEWD